MSGLWEKRVYGLEDADALACALIAHTAEIAAAMGLDESFKGAVFCSERYQVGAMTVTFRGERSCVTGAQLWTECGLSVAPEAYAVQRLA